MKKIFAALLAMVAIAFATLALAVPANATGGGNNDQPAENKDVTFCHATGSATNPYNKITTSLNSFINAGHIGGGQPGTHDGDIYPAITYVTKGGQTVTIPAQGDQSLLAFEDCVKPAEDEKVAKPTPTIVDKCETKDDVLSVASGRGYTVGTVTVDGLVKTVVVTLEPGFAWADGTKTPLTFSHTFTDVDCDLPETGGVQTAAGAGIAALAMMGLAGIALARTRQSN